VLRRRALELTWPPGDEESLAALEEFKEHAAGTRLVLNLIGTFVFALSRAAAGVKECLDLFGVLVLSFAAASSGGMLRDLLPAQVPTTLRSELYAVAALAGAVVVVVGHALHPQPAAVATPGAALYFGLCLMAIRRSCHLPIADSLQRPQAGADVPLEGVGFFVKV
jgi:uncharacterized membrane protein YeiH